MNSFPQKHKSTIVITLVINAVTLAVVVVLLSLGGVFSLSEQSQPKNAESNTYVPESKEETLVIETVERANPAVVSIVATAETPSLSEREREFLKFFAPYLTLPEDDKESSRRQIGGGSGFFVSSDGLIVTNRHVVDSEQAQYSIVTRDGEEYKATVIAKDPTYDIAILDVEVEGVDYLEFGDSDDLRLGQTVVAIGNALAQFSHSISKGVVSGLSRSIQAASRTGSSEFLQDVIQTDAAINPGNSGGPLLNLNGEVVGMNVAMAVDSENIGFALPANIVSQVVESVKETGEIIRPYIGVWYREISPELARAEDLSVDYGVIVTEGRNGEGGVVEDSPAEEAGIEAGDIITAIAGEEIRGNTVFATEIRKHNVGDTVTLTVLRDGEELKIDVTLERAPETL